MKQLDLPTEIAKDANATEIARIINADDQQTYLLDVRQFDDPMAWGIFAVDLMKHAARAYQQQGGLSKEDAYKRILAGLMAEMQNPTEAL